MELHQSLDLPSEQLEKYQILFGPKMVDFHTREYKQLHQYSTCLPQFHMIYVKPRERHNKHSLQCHSISHLQKESKSQKSSVYLQIDSPIKTMVRVRTWFYVIRKPKIDCLKSGTLLLGCKKKILRQKTHHN